MGGPHFRSNFRTLLGGMTRHRRGLRNASICRLGRQAEAEKKSHHALLSCGVRRIEDAYGGSSPHSYTVCVCDYSRSRGRHKCRHPRKAKSAYLQNMHICKSCVSAQPAYLQNLTEHLRKQDRKSSTNHRIFMILRGSGGLSGRPCQKAPKSSFQEHCG